MKLILPCCPRCKSEQTIGRVSSYNFKTANGITAYYCSNCLTEFDINNEILNPVWLSGIELEKDAI